MIKSMKTVTVYGDKIDEAGEITHNVAATNYVVTTDNGEVTLQREEGIWHQPEWSLFNTSLEGIVLESFRLDREYEQHSYNEMLVTMGEIDVRG